MGIHVKGELVAKVDFSPWGEGEFRVRSLPEESTNDLGIPLIVELEEGELNFWVHENWFEIPLGEGLSLRVKKTQEDIKLSFTLPYREWLGEREVIELNQEPLKKIAQRKPDRKDLINALNEATQALASVEEDADELLKSGPLGPKGFQYFEEEYHD